MILNREECKSSRKKFEDQENPGEQTSKAVYNHKQVITM
jgi:hypothetical protein